MTPFEKAYQQLNPEQKLAVDTIEGPVLVLAGPGTGKTQILSTRIAQIIQVAGVEPRNILALTFTNAGAKNMQQRLVSLMGPPGYAVKCATFHSFCGDIITSHPDMFPIRLDVTDSASDVDRFALIEEILRSNDLPLLKPRGDSFRSVQSILSLISNYKREGQSILTLRELAEAEKAAADSGELTKREAESRRKVAEKNLEVIEVMGEYERLMRERGLYDYDDIILWVRDAFRKNEDLLLDYQEQFHYVLIDEFQDTNQAQLQVAQALLSHWKEDANIFAVGDPNQSIYRFQGASLANTLSFLELYPSAEVITLKSGYRCGQPIYDVAAELIRNNKLELQDERLYDLYDPLQHFSGKSADLFTHAAENSLTECLWIVERIQKLEKDGVPLDQIAVLYRQHKHARLLESVFEKAGIAYEIDDGSSILDHPFIVQVLALLRFLVALTKGTEAPNILPVFHQTWFGLDPTDVLRLVRAAKGPTPRSAWDILMDDALLTSLPLKHPELLVSLRDKIIAWQHRDGQVAVGALVEEVLREAGIFRLSFSGELPLVNINVLTSFLRSAHEWSQQNPAGLLADWLDRLALMQRHGLGIAENDLDLRQKAVKLSSAHKAKGQEWEHVFILHSQDGYWGNRKGHHDLKPLPGTVPYAELDTHEHNEDERRLFYVALTRAKNSLTICWSSRTAEGDRNRELQPTQFTSEMVGGAWQQQPILEPAITRQRIVQFLETQSQSWLSPAVDRQWVQSLLREHFSLSPSSLHDYLECPAKFLYYRVIRLPQAPLPHLAAGTAAHAALEFIFRRLKETSEVPPLPAVHQRIDETLASMPFSPDQKTTLAAEAKSVVTGYYHANSAEFVPALEVEKTLGRIPPIVFEGLSLNGKIDRIDMIDDIQKTVRVVDYKDAKPKSRNALMGKTQEKNDYFRQLVFYALLAQLDSGFSYRVLEGEIVFLRPKEASGYASERFTILPEHIDDLQETLREVKKGLDSLSFLDRPACGSCDACQHLGLEKSMLDSWANASEGEERIDETKLVGRGEPSSLGKTTQTPPRKSQQKRE